MFYLTFLISFSNLIDFLRVQSYIEVLRNEIANYLTILIKSYFSFYSLPILFSNFFSPHCNTLKRSLVLLTAMSFLKFRHKHWAILFPPLFPQFLKNNINKIDILIFLNTFLKMYFIFSFSIFKLKKKIKIF